MTEHDRETWTDARPRAAARSGSRPTGPTSGARPHDPRRLSDRVIERERADPTWAGPFDDAFPAGASASIEASSGRPTGTREVGELVGFCRLPGERAGLAAPAREGRLSSQSPRGSRAVSARTTPFLPYTHGAAEREGRQPTRSRRSPRVGSRERGNEPDADVSRGTDTRRRRRSPRRRVGASCGDMT